MDISDVLRCKRMRFLKYNNAPSDTYLPEDLRMFDMGNVVEDLLFKVFDGAGLLRRTQQYIVSRIDERIRGKLDFVLSLAGLNKVVEVKSQGDFPYQKRTKKKDPQSINPRYGAQALTYVDTLLTYPQEQIDKEAIIVEVRRSDLELHETPVVYSQEVFAPIEADFRETLLAIDENRLPPVLPDFPSNWECSYCRFKGECKRLFREGKP
jgi:CRISPR/Cas system-associated exonuclease Cas4 (RecB family)